MGRQEYLELVALDPLEFQPQGLMRHLQASLEERCVQRILLAQLVFKNIKPVDELNYLIIDEFILQAYG